MARDALQQPIGRLDQEVRQRAKADSRVKVLTQLPGVGPFTVLVLLAEIGDITRFGSARKLAVLGRPSPHRPRHGPQGPARAHLQAGPAWLRWVHEPGRADRQAVTRTSPPATEAIARRRGKKIATIAVARKLLTRAYHLLTVRRRRQHAARRP